MCVCVRVRPASQISESSEFFLFFRFSNFTVPEWGCQGGAAPLRVPKGGCAKWVQVCVLMVYFVAMGLDRAIAAQAAKAIASYGQQSYAILWFSRIVPDVRDPKTISAEGRRCGFREGREGREGCEGWWIEWKGCKGQSEGKNESCS